MQNKKMFIQHSKEWENNGKQKLPPTTNSFSLDIQFLIISFTHLTNMCSEKSG